MLMWHIEGKRDRGKSHLPDENVWMVGKMVGAAPLKKREKLLRAMIVYILKTYGT